MLSLLAALLLLSAAHGAPCNSASITSTSTRVGTTSEFVNRATYNVAGTLEILNDCEFRVVGFTLRLGGPAVYWYGSSLTALSFDTELSPNRITTNPSIYNERIKDGLDWDDFDRMSVWCRAADLNFGDAAVGTAQPTAAPTLQACTNGVLDGDETDVDCGGPGCAGCAPGETCVDGSDCDSGICLGDSTCSTNRPTAAPTEFNGGERSTAALLWLVYALQY